MKKFLRIPIVIVLLLGVWFVYVIKNPSLPISQKVLTRLWISTTVQPELSGQTNTGIDLTNCVAYFDGCNNCTVKDGKPEACTLMYCETPSQPRCTQYATGAETNTWTAGLANPASVNCVKNGWTVIIEDSTGGQIWICTFPDGTTCEERAYMRHECPFDNPNSACTMEAKVCPDGSSVGRTGPNCEFAPCPGSEWSGEWSWPVACNMIYAPVCASVAIECIKAPCYPVQQTFSNRCVMEQNKLATFVHDGECGSVNR